MSSKCNMCGEEVSIGDGGVTGLEHKEGCAHLVEVEWVDGEGKYPNVPGVNPEI